MLNTAAWQGEAPLPPPRSCMLAGRPVQGRLGFSVAKLKDGEDDGGDPRHLPGDSGRSLPTAAPLRSPPHVPAAKHGTPACSNGTTRLLTHRHRRCSDLSNARPPPTLTLRQGWQRQCLLNHDAVELRAVIHAPAFESPPCRPPVRCEPEEGPDPRGRPVAARSAAFRRGMLLPDRPGPSSARDRRPA